MTLFKELKRRNVFRVGAAYALAAWVLLQIVDFVLDAIGAPNWILQVFILAAAVGLPIVLAFSWVFEVTPEGLKRESEIDRSQSITSQTGRKLDRVIIAILALAVAILLVDRVWSPAGSPADGPMSASSVSASQALGQKVSEETAAASSAVVPRSVAVLPFVSMSNGADDGYFADGLTEEILNALAQLPELLVTARTSAFHFKGKDLPIQEIARKLGVANVVEGSVRRSGERLRVTAQLIRANDGFHLWSENYDSTAQDTIKVQEDIAEQIALAMDVVMDEGRREAMRRSGLRDPEAFVALQKGLELYEKAHGDPDLIDLLAQANEYFEIVQRRVPTYAFAYQLHSDLYVHQLSDQATVDTSRPDYLTNLGDTWAKARADYAAVMRYAATPEEQVNAQIDLAFITGETRGIRGLLERWSRQTGCMGSNWAENFALPFGMAAEALPRLNVLRNCDPFSTSAWRAEVRTALWAGHPQDALRIAVEGAQSAPGEWLSTQLVATLVALGRYEEAETEISTRFKVREDALIARVQIAAARGDRDRVKDLINEYRDTADNGGDFWIVMMAAWAGDQEVADQIASRIDQHPFGTPALSTITLWCLCGAPWDLSVTPNFAAAIQHSGLDWPPASPIRFPQKTW